MKTLCTFLLALALCCAPLALADTAVQSWVLFQPGSVFTDDFDADGVLETMLFVTDLNEYDDGSFLISAGSQSFTVLDCVGLIPEVNAMRVGDSDSYYGTLFMISEYGPSDDPLTYCYLYAFETLHDLGRIPALAKNLKPDGNGVFTTMIRASMVGTWERPADYALAFGIDSGDDWSIHYRLVEVPRALYPMNMMATLKRDLTLSSSIYEDRADVDLKAGTPVIFAASDDVSRLYITQADGGLSGWASIRHSDGEYWAELIRVNGKYVELDEVFDGIFYAD